MLHFSYDSRKGGVTGLEGDGSTKDMMANLSECCMHVLYCMAEAYNASDAVKEGVNEEASLVDFLSLFSKPLVRTAEAMAELEENKDEASPRDTLEVLQALNDRTEEGEK